MRIMIFSAATGAGHDRAAGAVEQYLLEKSEHEVIRIDALKAIGKPVDRTICSSYLFMAKRVPGLFGKLYQQSNKENKLSALVPKASAMIGKRLGDILERHEPDVVVTTHPFATEMIAALKRKGRTNAALVCVMTDYGIHKAWLEEEVDAYIVACEEMIPAMVAAGVKRERVYPFGIPVLQSFFEPADVPALRARLGLAIEGPTVLFMAGSFGVTRVMKLYQQVVQAHDDMQIVVITGRNPKLYKGFEEELAAHPAWQANTKLLFFTQEVDQYMKAADLLMTKPGGLTTSEALACNLPLLAFDAIPGQEEDNANFLVSRGMGVRMKRDEDAGAAVGALMKDPQRLAQMRENCKNFDTSQCCAQMLELFASLVRDRQIALGVGAEKDVW